MFLSKIWFFLVALAAAVAMTIALVMPRPAQRTQVTEEQNRLAVACGVIDILLADEARNRVEIVGSFARTKEVVSALESASGAKEIDEQRMKTVRDVGENVMKGIQGRKPDFAMLIDKRGRVVARVKLDEGDFGDVVAGRPLVDDALAGFLRDDLWAENGTMYLVSAAPVIKRDPPVTYVGAVVIGHKVTTDLAQKLVSSLNVDVGFYLGNDDVAGSKSIAVDHVKMIDAVKKLTSPDVTRDCQAGSSVELHSGNGDYTALVARLPGEAQSKLAYYAVLIKRQETVGFSGTLKVVRQNDLAFNKVPWFLVGGGFLVALALGIGLMFVEADRPLRRLAQDAVRLAKGDKDRLSELEHGGKYGSIARSVNIHIDKLGREAKSARTNLDQLLGPAPEGSLGTIDLLAGPLPAARPGGPAPAASPPPSEFRFNDSAGVAVPKRTPTPPSVPARPTPPPMPRAASQPGPAMAPSAPLRLDDDILGGATTVQTEEGYFKQVYEQFLAVKKTCNEPTGGLSYPKFAEKLIKNREDLMAKTGCREVRFTVYVKDGKAALKATPVKEEV